MTASAAASAGGATASVIASALLARPAPVAAAPVMSDAVEAALGSVEVVRLPAVRGRAVWPLAGEAKSAVAEWPNALGVYEEQPALPVLVLAGAGAPDPGWQDAELIEIEDGSGGAAAFAARTRAAALLCKHLAQLPGMQPAFGKVEAPTVVMISPADPSTVVAACASSGSGNIAVDAPTVAGLPGAVRFRIGAGVGDEELAALAAAIPLGRDE
jgi:hypothetical protein